MVKVSVIIPVYNNEYYLCKCLDSVVCQTLEDIEIICVDDCSTDCSNKILKRYEQIDERIKIIYNTQNRGQAFSRNKALDIAQGEYIQFLDSDDCLRDRDVLESLYAIAVQNKLDLLKSEWDVLENGDIKKTIQYPIDVVGNIYSGRNLLYNLEIYNICARITFSNFVRRKFLTENKIVFYNDIIHEDILYSYDLYYYAEKAMCVNLCTYFYVKHDNTTTTRRKDTEHLKGHLVCINEIIKKDFLNASIEFRYATIKYLIRIYNEIVYLREELKYHIVPELFNDEIKRLYNMLWGDRYLNYISRESIVLNIEKMMQSKRLYIYGAGRAAQELLVILEKYDISIDGVFVTNIENSAKTILGHKVLGIDTYVPSDKSTMFLVAITKKYVGNVIDLLWSKGIENIIYVC